MKGLVIVRSDLQTTKPDLVIAQLVGKFVNQNASQGGGAHFNWKFLKQSIEVEL